MEIISHRGYWRQDNEKNKRVAFERSFDLGYGTETDLRDSHGEIVISHDMPCGDEVSLREFLGLYRQSGCTGTLALNIKADGLQERVRQELKAHEIENYFLFDMSVPDCLVSLNYGLTCFSRFSEYEPKSVLWDKCQGVWYDSFHGTDLDPEILDAVISEGKRVCIVSSELHKRSYQPLWESLSNLKLETLCSDKLILCTDIAETARDYFNGK
jgi:glycerophosphoryl diester phosphodiesterase